MIPALISAAVALMIFTWTQWVTGLRSRHDLLRSKLEELCRLVVALRGKVLKAMRTLLPADLEEQRRIISETKQSIVDDALTIQMLAGLYFPVLADHIARIVSTAEASLVGHREHADALSRPTSYQLLFNPKAAELLGRNTHEFVSFVNLEYARLTQPPSFWATSLMANVEG